MIDAKQQNDLRDRYNPDGSPLRKAQLRMLELLVFLDDICKKHSLRYWLDGGTLLGAMRHGGFIPWDDDTDVCMPRKDALRLQEILGSEIHDGKVVLQTTVSDPHYANSSWMTLRDLNSRYVQDYYAHNILRYKGLQVDIFMMDSNVHPLAKKISHLLHDFLVYAPLENRHRLKFLRPLVGFNHRVLDHVAYPMLRGLKRRDRSLTYGIGTPFDNRYSESDIFPLKKIKFEGMEFSCPNNPEQYLRNLYGDWEKIPEPDRIVIHTDTIEFI